MSTENYFKVIYLVFQRILHLSLPVIARDKKFSWTAALNVPTPGFFFRKFIKMKTIKTPL